jgi:PAS domain S-box-containing protein
MQPNGGTLPARACLSALAVAAAAAFHLLLPELPRFLLLLPAILLAAFIGGKWMGGAALLAAALFVALERLARVGAIDAWDAVGLACFLAAGILSIGVVDLYHKAVARLSRERHRLRVALEAAGAALWELSADGHLFWDENFYRLVGLDPTKTPPATPTFLEMIHPDDRARMAEARRLMDERREPRRSDEYRLTRPDGETIWLENHRTRLPDSGDHFIGITQDITRRKHAELRVQALLREADHRAKNQLTVIMAVARETSRTTDTAAEFEEAFGVRLKALARSHDLMLKGDWQGTTLRELVLAHVMPFGAETRCEVSGPDIIVSASAAQYLGMAFHELATNAAKHGSLLSDRGTIRVAWEVRENPAEPELALTWTESGGPSPSDGKPAGFGTKVLLQLAPAALLGRAHRELTPEGLRWTLVAPLRAIAAEA